jgi:hypothetical protein
MDDSFQACPECTKRIRKQASVCRFCGASDLMAINILLQHLFRSGSDPRIHIHYMNLCLRLRSIEKISRQIEQQTTPEVRAYWQNEFTDILAEWELNQSARGLDRSADTAKLVALYNIDQDKYREAKETKWKHYRSRLINEIALRGWRLHIPPQWEQILSKTTELFGIHSEDLSEVCESIDNLFGNLERETKLETDKEQLIASLSDYGLNQDEIQAELNRRFIERSTRSKLNDSEASSEPFDQTNVQAAVTKIRGKIALTSTQERHLSRELDRTNERILIEQQRSDRSRNESQSNIVIASDIRIQELKFHKMALANELSEHRLKLSRLQEKLKQLEETTASRPKDPPPTATVIKPEPSPAELAARIRQAIEALSSALELLSQATMAQAQKTNDQPPEQSGKSD